MRLANKGISSFNRGRIRAEGQGLVRSELHDAPPTSHLSSTLIIIHYSIFISHPQAAESSVCNGQLGKGGEFRLPQYYVCPSVSFYWPAMAGPPRPIQLLFLRGFFRSLLL